ncbi:uncharacterized protein LOC129742146 [Uranotaenia lowii]|uniref:uncharacterized protein LOC129742146 n=1 Tax=Uranotaenia lowii TaxID=190385 RepID=UPI002478E9C0|nr:uncharacterized protein LOC129742146 [Uranotaenia lowii]
MCENWVQNYSGEDLPNNVLRSLQLGSGYNCPDPHCVPYVKILSEIECAIQQHPQAPVIRNDISNAIVNHINYAKQSAHDNHEWVREEIRKSKIFFKSRPDLLVTKADKGKAIVVIKRNEYEEKMRELLNDKETYVSLDKDPTVSV